ncbi:hypothetical protein N7532_011489 [Penicillium argentinense]|uniref:Copper-fist domain-containing protein n=1 Tax=Penicillium argentinense TaxID=1131581 RepID=A0A9W9EIH2_9EURO|nr:uncharacterized protein N7532_011489 [Penicillium argentinense]KAJ5082446.1 hypothetical protein N7532_011489 [Penicillium argentinense]
MPYDEEGVKWSCEPCIRGHRSSKCDHFERIMMKVPKAGRPLSKCPHVKGTCSCQKTYAVMVRIPKGSSCLCRPVKLLEGGDKHDSAQGSRSHPTPSSSPASNNQWKVQKASRKNETVQYASERVAKALENRPDLDAMPNNVKVEEGPSSDSCGYSLWQLPQTSQSNCCSKKPQAEHQPPLVAQNGGGSCCGGGSASQPAAPSTQMPEYPIYPTYSTYQPSQPASWSGAPYTQYSTSQAPWQNATAPMQGPFMPAFGTHGNQFPFGQMNGLETPHSQTSMSFTPTSQTPAYTPGNTSADSNNDCECGDGCQCLGCAVHPFNNTTRQHVQEMGAMMTLNGYEKTPDSMTPAYQPSANSGSAISIPPSYYVPQNHHHIESYPDHHVNQQLMPSSEYYTLEYPVQIPSACSDVTGSCQCGSDCSCVGCLTHSGHTGMSMQSFLPQSMGQNNSAAGQAQPGPYDLLSDEMYPPELNDNAPFHQQQASGAADGHTSRIPVLENVDTHCLSPRTLQTSMM